MIKPLPTVTHVLPRPKPPPQRPAQRTASLRDFGHNSPDARVQTDVYTYPATSNKLGSISLGAGGSRAFTYDAAGNVTYDNRAVGGYGYTYNAAGRMSEFTISGVLKASYKYDFAGRQAIRALAGGITIHSVFDSAGNRIAEYNEATGALIREYVWFNGAPLAVIEGGVTTFIRADQIGRPVFGTNTAGTKVWTAAYLPFGGVRTTTGTPITARFPGQWFQSESGLHQNWMRDYDPTTGRYLQADPLGLVDGASIYGYVKQNPGRWIDPTGLQSRSIDDLVCDNFPGMGYCQQRPMQCSANETICRKVDEYPVPDMGQKVCVYDCGGDGLLRTYHGLFETCDEVVFIPGF